MKKEVTATSMNVAQYILLYCYSEMYDIGLERLQQMLWLVQTEAIIQRKKAMFWEKFAVWEIGPVIERIWNRFERYGVSRLGVKNPNQDSPLSKEDKEIIREVIEKYEYYSEEEIRNTIKSSKIWKECVSNADKTGITPLLMEKFYDGRVKKLTPYMKARMILESQGKDEPDIDDLRKVKG